MLNEQQIEAMSHNKGAALCLASAGSGKTQVLAERVARLVNSGVFPDRILAITFSKKAAISLRDRIAKKIGDTRDMQVSTFHSLGFRIIREEIESISKYRKGLEVVEGGEKKSLLKDLLQSRRRDGSSGMGWDDADIGECMRIISLMKREVISPVYAQDYLEEEQDTFEPHLYADLYYRYEQEKQKINKIDYDDMIYLPVILFRDKPKVRQAWKNRYDFILVDECQDNNKAQFQIASFLAEDHRNIFLVGDDFQCQPANTEVLLSTPMEDSFSHVTLEDIKIGDAVVAYSNEGDRLVGLLKRASSVVLDKRSREYTGFLYTLLTGGKSSKSTSEHRWLVSLNKKAEP